MFRIIVLAGYASKTSIFHDHLSKKITDEKKEIKILIRIVYSSVYIIATHRERTFYYSLKYTKLFLMHGCLPNNIFFSWWVYEDSLDMLWKDIHVISKGEVKPTAIIHYITRLRDVRQKKAYFIIENNVSYSNSKIK